MTLYQKISNIPYGAILNAPLTLLVAGKLLHVCMLYLEKQIYPQVERAFKSAYNEEGCFTESSGYIAGLCNMENQREEEA